MGLKCRWKRVWALSQRFTEAVFAVEGLDLASSTHSTNALSDALRIEPNHVLHLGGEVF